MSLTFLVCSSYWQRGQMLRSSNLDDLEVTSEKENEGARARLFFEAESALVQVHSIFVNENLGADTLSYELQAERSGESGPATTKHSGTFSTAPGEASTLGTIPLSIRTGDCVTAHLAVYDEGQKVSEDRIQLHFSS